eukprot:7376188-Prymnesium_polylepis.2
MGDVAEREGHEIRKVGGAERVGSEHRNAPTRGCRSQRRERAPQRTDSRLPLTARSQRSTALTTHTALTRSPHTSYRPLARVLSRLAQTLDLSFEEDETFGLALAALRTLQAERRERPAAYPSPSAPVHASAISCVLRGAPMDATRCELWRDAALRSLVTFFMTRPCKLLEALWWLSLLCFGTTFAIAEFFVGDHDAALVGINAVTACLTVASLVTFPWRLANTVHLWGRGRSCREGVDFYGRPTTGIWWHIPPARRKWIVVLLLVNTGMQWLNQLFRWVWVTYEEAQEPGTVGMLLILISSLLSMLGGIGGGISQGLAELVVRRVHPGVFPPTPLAFAIEAWARERRQWSEEVQEASDTARDKTRTSKATLSTTTTTPTPTVAARGKAAGTPGWNELGAGYELSPGMSDLDCMPPV